MKMFASGEAQSLAVPGEFLSGFPFGRVIGIVDLGRSNSANDFGWCGLKAVIAVEGHNYVLDFPERVRLETDDGIELFMGEAADPLGWMPSFEDQKRYGLRHFDLTR